jgi:hypothetical protein
MRIEMLLKNFSLISKDVFDVNKPLNASSLHDYNKTENSTLLTNDIKASINTNELTINKK